MGYNPFSLELYDEKSSHRFQSYRIGVWPPPLPSLQKFCNSAIDGIPKEIYTLL